MNRQYPDRPVVGVGAVIMKDWGILLERRRNDPGKGKWSSPGGIVELGETIEEAVVREVKEETGLDVEMAEHIDVVDSITLDENGKTKYHFVILDYVVKIEGGRLKASSDAEVLKWVKLEDVGGYNLTKAFRAFFHRNRFGLEAYAQASAVPHEEQNI